MVILPFLRRPTLTQVEQLFFFPRACVYSFISIKYNYNKNNDNTIQFINNIKKKTGKKNCLVLNS